jgi:cation diffusion facilitator CzcD-associated flavoprotein CzcO
VSEQPRILIIGAGFGGIAAAIELQAHGFTEVEILDRGEALGGTWRFNDYPGSACDVPAHFYSLSYAQRRDWSRLCPTRDEIVRYQEQIAREYGVERRMTFGVEVERCDWDDAGRTWTVAAADGRSWEADAVIVATGQLHRPLLPSIPGLEDFAGTAFHSAEWDHGCDLRGKRVAVIGTGASAVQFVPEVAKEAGHLDVFQRTGNWFMPRRNRHYPPPVAFAIRRVPGVQAFRRGFIRWYTESLTFMIRNPRTVGLLGRLRSTLFMRWQLRGDDELRRRVWPDYTFGCKRILFSSMWLPALRRPNVELVTERIERMTPAGPQTSDGVVHEADVVIHGTGFKTHDFMFPMEIHGENGLSLREAWGGEPHAYLGMAVPRFPSLFLMYGPNTNTSGGSIIEYLEAQSRYIRQALALVRERGAAAIEVRPEVEAAADRALQARFQGTAWTRCDSWYRDESGRIITNWPGYMFEYVAATRELDPADFELMPAPDREPAPA